jgi:PKD repeat protein
LKQSKTAKHPTWLALIVILAFCFCIPRSNAAGEAILSIDPPAPAVAVGEIFNVSIRIDNLPSPNGATGFQIEVAWDPRVLTGINMSDVIFHSVTPESEWDNIWGIQNIVNNTGGKLAYAYTFQDSDRAKEGGYAPISGNHTLAVVTFKGTATGVSPLTFVLLNVGDANAQAIPCTALNGEVTVGNPFPTLAITSPENTTYATTSVGLAFKPSKNVSWIGYSLDGLANVTVTGNVSMTISDGQHDLVIYANDTAGQMGASEKIYFTVDTTPPVASFTYSQTTPEAQLVHGAYRWNFTFDATESHDPLSNTLTCFWDFDDGTNGTGLTISHVYKQSGSFDVNLTVTNEAGIPASQVKTITINAASEATGFPFGLIAIILIPVLWIPALSYYLMRTRKKKKTK